MRNTTLSVLLLAAAAAAQDPFLVPRREALPPDPDDANRARAADFDGDGRVDLMFANGFTAVGGPSRLWRQFEPLLFEDATARLAPEAGQTSDAAIGDVDGDGDLDLVLGQLDEDSRLYLNDGTGNLVDVTAQRLPAARGGTRAVLLFDADGDGDLDLFVGNGLGSNGELDELYFNDGQGQFAPAAPSWVPGRRDQTWAAVACDIENDGDLDLILGTQAGPRLYGNIGTRFNDGTSQRLPALTDRVYDLAAGDVDGDGDVDLILATPFQNRLLLNNGLGVFLLSNDGLPSVSDKSRAVVLGDLDGDGDLDAVFGNGEDMDGSANRLLLNRGDGRFDETTGYLPHDVGGTRGLALADLDGDGDLDLVCANSWFHGAAPSTVMLNDGSARFVDLSATPVPRLPDWRRDFAVGDLDGDGDLDVAGAGFRSEGRGTTVTDGLRVRLADGYGNFRTVPTPAVSPDTRAVALLDVDGDGDLDLAGAAWGQDLWLLLNDGRGQLSAAPAGAMPALAPRAESMVAADLDGDGDLDLVVGTAGGEPQRVLINDGAGRFADQTAARTPSFANHSTLTLVAADLDGDGDLDLVGAGSGWSSWAWRNDGTGHFTDAAASWIPGAPHSAEVVAVGDVDGDGDLDLSFGTDRLWLNRGDGVCDPNPAGSVPAPAIEPAGLLLVDVDGDGDLDMVGVGDGRRIADSGQFLLLNDGAGAFRRDPETWTLEYPRVWSCVAAADLDDDGDADLLLGAAGDHFAYGRAQQLEVPELPFVGLDLAVRAHALGWPAGTRGLVLWSPAPARVPLAGLGVLRLDPTLLGVLAEPTIDPETGTAELRRRIPADPGLVGAPIHVQALLLAPPAAGGRARLTNAAREELR